MSRKVIFEFFPKRRRVRPMPCEACERREALKAVPVDITNYIVGPIATGRAIQEVLEKHSRTHGRPLT